MIEVFGEAFSPSGISSFFEVCTHNEEGNLISNPEKVGARGGGFALSKGVRTKAYCVESDITEIEVYINDEQMQNAKTTETVVNNILKISGKQHEVRIDHVVEVPIGAGFGTSAAGALSCGLALSQALRLHLTYNQIARIAHVAEVLCNTGLGTVEGLTVGGLVLVVESGAVGYGLVDRIPLGPSLNVVAGVFRAIDKGSVMYSKEKIKNINVVARKTMRLILEEPTLDNFLKRCRQFSTESGLASRRVRRLIEDAEDAGAIGAAQNMIGEAVHAITTRSDLGTVYEVFSEHLPEEKIIVSEIDFHGARLLI